MTVEMVPTTINGRWELLLPQHRAERPQWNIENGGWEPERLAAMADIIRPGHIVYDIGAEEGDFPALFASWGARLALFEPNPRVWPNIKAIFQANDLEDHVVSTFVGFVGEVERHNHDWVYEHSEPWDGIWPACAGGPIIGDHGFLVLPERPEVPVTTIDESAKHLPPDVITIDVEGAELTVLRGADRVLSEIRPTVFVSVHIDMPWIDEKYPGDTGEKLDAYMQSHDYVGTHLATDHEEHWMYRPEELT